MTTFDEREAGQERSFSAGEQNSFKARARRDKLLGLWAAQKLGMDDAKAEAFAMDLVKLGLEAQGEEHVFTRVYEALHSAGVEQSEHQVRRTMTQLLAQAGEELSAGV